MAEQMSDVQLHQTMDGVVWAREFMRITGGTVDEATAIAWFCNAIMAGWDHRTWQTPEYKAQIARVLAPASPGPTPEGRETYSALAALSVARDYAHEQHQRAEAMEEAIHRVLDADVMTDLLHGTGLEQVLRAALTGGTAEP
jgi:hypothetical protein